jgi:hypothetical protein
VPVFDCLPEPVATVCWEPIFLLLYFSLSYSILFLINYLLLGIGLKIILSVRVASKGLVPRGNPRYFPSSSYSYVIFTELFGCSCYLLVKHYCCSWVYDFYLRYLYYIYFCFSYSCFLVFAAISSYNRLRNPVDWLDVFRFKSVDYLFSEADYLFSEADYLFSEADYLF